RRTVRRPRRAEHARRTVAPDARPAGAGGGHALPVPARGAARRSLLDPPAGCRVRPRRAIAAAALLVATLAGAGAAAAERLVASISRHLVLVTSSFTGTSIVLFGTIEPDSPTARRRSSGYDLVVTVSGPKQTIIARRKERVIGIWTNMASRTFLNVPSY